MRISPLEAWAAERTGGDLAAWQLRRLNETLALARESRWYRRRLPERVGALSDLAGLPLMSAEDLREQGSALACVPQREVARIVTLSTSGSAGAPKRVYFTGADQEGTVDYFHHGLATLVRPGDRMMVCYPCRTPGGLGDLICRALARIPAVPVPWGVIGSLEEAGALLEREGVETLVGFPVQLLALAKYCAARKLRCRVRAVLLSADAAVPGVSAALARLWGCEVFEHYGMTEMGLGCAVDCAAHAGLHIRENDLLLEVVDGAGRPVPDGIEGELAFTTLTRTAMPLIRYRTGDRSALLPGRCPCGCALRRIAPPRRMEGGALSLAAWDEALLPLPGLSDFRITLRGGEVLLEAEGQRACPALSAPALEEAVRHLLPRGMELQVRILCRENRLELHRGCKRTIGRACPAPDGHPHRREEAGP